MIKKWLSYVLSFLLVLSSVGVEQIVAAGRGIYDNDPAWSEYVWTANSIDNFLKTYQEDAPDTKYIVYSYNANRATPDGNKYRKINIHNNNFDLLWDQLSSRDTSEWDDPNINPNYKTFDAMKKDLLHVISRGWPSNDVNLRAKFPNASEADFYRGTQEALWSIIHVNPTYLQTDIAQYIISAEDPVPVPDNLQLSYFQAETNYQVDNLAGRANLLALEFVEDTSKFVWNIPVEKTWGGIPSKQIDQQPEVRVNIKRNGELLTYLNLNAKNGWKVTYKDEISLDDGMPSYEVVEVSEGGKECSAGENIVLSDGKTYQLNISGDSIDGFIVNNHLEGITNLPARVSVNKISSDTKENLVGASLRLVKSNGTAVENEEWITDGTEKEIALDAGEYRLEEISAPEGYKVATPIEFRITDAGALEVKIGEQWLEQETLSITMEDTPIIKKDITIKKVASDTQSDLQGAKLKITTSDGSPVQGGEWVTDGTEKVFNLQEGEYILQEVEVPEGYIKADDIMFRITDTGTLEVKQTDDTWNLMDNLLITMVDQKVEVIPVEKEVTFRKVSVENGAEQELEGAKVKVVKGETKDGELVKTWTTTTTSKKVTLPVGTYTMVENVAPTGYEIASPITFRITDIGELEVLQNGIYTKQDDFVIKMVDNKTPEIPDNSYELTFSKVEVNTTNELEGATLQIFSGETTNVEPLHTWVSTKEQRKISLKEGIYTMVEKQAPDGYEVAENIIFQVLSNGAIQIKENGNWVDRLNTMVRMEDKKKVTTPNSGGSSNPSISNDGGSSNPSTSNGGGAGNSSTSSSNKPSNPTTPSSNKPSNPTTPNSNKPSKPATPNNSETVNSNNPDYSMGLYGNHNLWNKDNDDTKTNTSLKLNGQSGGTVDLQGADNVEANKFNVYGTHGTVVKTNDKMVLKNYIELTVISLLGMAFYMARRRERMK